MLEAPITALEWDWALRSSPSGKVPGPDGFTLPYYKLFSTVLRDHFLTAFNSLSSGSTLPVDSLRAHIAVISKEGKDPSLCQNYRPISLLNLDLKLFAKIIAARLTPLLQSIIHLDQVGFMPTREARDNTTRAINVIHYACSKSLPTMLLSTDAEKAFDRVSWPFLQATLCHLGLGPNMLAWIGSLYSRPSAQVSVNGLLSPSFSILNGTRQGCPLSPLIFILTLEPFLRQVRQNPNISGVRVGSTEHKVAAYADDLLFFLTQPAISLPNLLAELEIYRRLSNYKINLLKSEALNLSLSPDLVASLVPSFPFRWSRDSLTYLGVQLTPKAADLFKANFPPILKTIEADLLRWHKGTFTWFGRCSIFKMNVLPRVLYLIQALPVSVPRYFFRQLSSLLTRFVWAHKQPRLAKAVLSRPKTRGGVGLPDVYQYYVAAHLSRVVDWHRHSSSKLWVGLEEALSPLPLTAAAWRPTSARDTGSHPTITPTLLISHKHLSAGFLAPHPSPLFPVLGNPSFPSGMEDPVFRGWFAAGKFRAASFLKGLEWLTLTELKDLTDPLPVGFWRALQLHHFLLSLPMPSAFSRTPTQFESLCLCSGPLRHTLSLIYAMLGSPPDQLPPPFLPAWESDLGISLTNLQIDRIYAHTHSSSISSRLQEAGYKILSRWYRVPTRLHRIFPEVSPLCWRNCGEDGSLLHIFWTCPHLVPFWKTVWRITSSLTDHPLPFQPDLFLLHISDIPLRAYRHSVIRHLINAARACIPLLWRSPDPPAIATWLRKVEDIRRLEDLTAQLHGRTHRFFRTWFYWNQFADSSEYKTLLSQ